MIDAIGIDSIWAASTGRKMFLAASIDDYDGPDDKRPQPSPGEADLATANLISSEVAEDRHLPVIDFDFPARVIPSSTEGHGHLYIEKEMTWAQYKALLDGLLAAGLIQEGWHRGALRDTRSYVRLPHVVKRDAVDKRGGDLKGLSSDYNLMPDCDNNSMF